MLKYGVQPAAIAAVPLVRGVCRAVGMKVLSVPEATGTYQTDFKAKAEAAVRAIQSHDFVFVHVKAPDLASHDRNPQRKVEMIRRIDGMVGQIIRNVDLGETLIAVTADHTTPVHTGRHEGDPVPLAIAGPGVRVDHVKEFGERSCAVGGLGRIRGVDVMPILMNLMGRVKEFGA